jgi:hypothetical protein
LDNEDEPTSGEINMAAVAPAKAFSTSSVARRETFNLTNIEFNGNAHWVRLQVFE